MRIRLRKLYAGHLNTIPEPGSWSSWAIAALAADMITTEPSSRPHTIQSWAGKYSDALTGMVSPQSSYRVNSQNNWYLKYTATYKSCTIWRTNARNQTQVRLYLISRSSHMSEPNRKRVGQVYYFRPFRGRAHACSFLAPENKITVFICHLNQIGDARRWQQVVKKQLFSLQCVQWTKGNLCDQGDFKRTQWRI